MRNSKVTIVTTTMYEQFSIKLKDKNTIQNESLDIQFHNGRLTMREKKEWWWRWFGFFLFFPLAFCSHGLPFSSWPGPPSPPPPPPVFSRKKQSLIVVIVFFFFYFFFCIFIKHTGSVPLWTPQSSTFSILLRLKGNIFNFPSLLLVKVNIFAQERQTRLFHEIM